MKANMAGQQRIVHYSGNVQGVGFRFTAIRIARGYDVTGTVRNLPDGRVECVVEGEPEQIDAFLAELGEAMRGYIHRCQQQTAPAGGGYDSFDVAF